MYFDLVGATCGRPRTAGDVGPYKQNIKYRTNGLSWAPAPTEYGGECAPTPHSRLGSHRCPSQPAEKAPLWVPFLLAGMAGFEPTDARVKVWCLTAWRHPNILPKSIISQKFKSVKNFLPNFAFNFSFIILYNFKKAVAKSRNL